MEGISYESWDFFPQIRDKSPAFYHWAGGKKGIIAVWTSAVCFLVVRKL